MRRAFAIVGFVSFVATLLFLAILLVYAGGPKFKHKDQFIQQEFRNVYSQLYKINIVESGTTPEPDEEGALFLDTDAGANGTLKMYSNGAWRTVTAF